jgi:malonate transporter and related proteins
MIDVFLDAVLPIFAVVAVGYAFGRAGLFDFSAATALNRFVFYLALPLLLFRLIATAPLERFEWWLVLAFLLAEIAVYFIGFMVAHFGFKRSRTESLLLGMATAFANQVFFVLPIARQLYGDVGALPVVAISIFDVVVLLVGTLLILDFAHNSDQGGAIGRPIRLLLRNPPIIGIAAGVIANLVGLPIVGGLDLFARFVGETAAPVSLFALGLVLMSQRGREKLSVPLTMSALKLIMMPAVAWVLVYGVFPISSTWANPAMLVAAGPAGAMPFVFALQYKVPVSAIAYTILISTIASLATVTIMTQIG